MERLAATMIIERIISDKEACEREATLKYMRSLLCNDETGKENRKC
jgi:hypothetical protein